MAAGLPSAAAGCEGTALGGWLGVTTFLGTWHGNQQGGTDKTTVERFCCENGQQVDCSTIPTP